MLTFLELYQTLLGFVFFKLYTDASLVYPPPLDDKKDEGGAGVGAFVLQEAAHTTVSVTSKKVKEVQIDGKRVTSKDVRQTIKSIAAAVSGNDEDVQMAVTTAEEPSADLADEDFVAHPSTSNPQEAASLPTFSTLSDLPHAGSSILFAPYTFWLSRETSRPIFEFLVRSFGGRIGWPETSGSGSPFDEVEESITHVIIDRPAVEMEDETDEQRERRRRRKFVQPQWIVDCINAGKILLEEPYAQGKTLPPHLSPFEDRANSYDPIVNLDAADVGMEEAESDEVSEPEGSESEGDGEDDEDLPETAALKAAATAEDAAALRAAELEAEAAGVDFGTFEKEARKARGKVKKVEEVPIVASEDDMNKMMMSNKQRKLYERMKHGERKRTVEVCMIYQVL